MKSFALIMLLSVSYYASPFFNEDSSKQYLIPSLDLPLPTPLPKNFRFVTKEFPPSPHPLPSREGLDQLRISASGQFTMTSFYLMLQKLPQKKIIVVDLREESHGFINGIPISWKLPDSTWTNIGKSIVQIHLDEMSRLDGLLSQRSVLLDPHESPLELNVSEIFNEKDLVESFGLLYHRIPITENHKPTNKQVDSIVNLILGMPKDVWLHVHCHGGRGRTTTFLIMYDILLNGKNVSLEDILERQILIGGSDMLKEVPEDDPKFEPITERYRFVRSFYDYCTTVDISKTTFSDWMQNYR